MSLKTRSRDATRHYPSRSPLYRKWEYIRKQARAKGLPLQASWAASFASFQKDIGEAPADGTYRLVLVNPVRGYVWYNVKWVPADRATADAQLRFLTYKRRKRELSEWAKEFGVRITAMEKWLDKGWSMRKIECHARRLARQKSERDMQLAKAGRAVSAVPGRPATFGV